MISVRDLQFRYAHGTFELKIPELKIHKGEKVVFVGPSGCGKTTLLYLLAGIKQTMAGNIQIANNTLQTLEDTELRLFRSQHIGFVFQQFELLEYLTGKENILLSSYLNANLTHGNTREQHLMRLSKAMGVSHLLGRFPGEMSQGEKQRIAICRAMIERPAIVMADEPTGNLDPAITRTIMDLLVTQVKEQASTLLMVTHDHSLLNYFDRVIDFSGFLEQGNL